MTSPSTRTPALIPSDHLRPVVQLLKGALRFWWAGLLTFALVSASAVAAVRWWPREYRSEAVLHYREGMRWTADDALSGRRVGQRLRETLLARALLAKVIDELGLFPELIAAGRTTEAVEEMRLATTFRYDQSDVLVVSYTAHSPEEAQRVTARLAELLIEEHDQHRASHVEAVSTFLDSEKKRMTEELAAKEAEQIRFVARHPEFALEQTSGIGVTFRASESRQSAPADGGGAPREAQPSPHAALVSAKNAAEARLAAARRELAERQHSFTELHPSVQVAGARVAEAEEALRRAVEALAEAQGASTGAAQPRAAAGPPTGGRVRRSGSVALETEWARLSREVNEARERLERLDAQQFGASMAASLVTSGQTSQIVVVDPAYLPARPVGVRPKIVLLMGVALALGLAGGVAVLLALLDGVIRDDLQVERLELAPVLAQVTRRSVRESERRAGGKRAKRRHDRPSAQAAAQAVPAAPRRERIVSLAGNAMAGPPPSGVRSGTREDESPLGRLLAVPLGLTTDRSGEPKPGTARHPEPDPARFVRAQPVDTEGVDGRVVMVHAPDAAAAASFRVLRHRIAERNSGSTTLVTSPRGKEGKTFTAVNLALALGEAGRARVLLIEANFRSPSLARVLGFQPPVGLAEQLQKHGEPTTPTQNVVSQAAAPWVVAEVLAPWLHVAALSPDSEAPVADARSFGVCVKQLQRAGYDHVVIDAPAVLEGAEVALVEESVDAIVMVLRAHKSRVKSFREAAMQIERGRLAGVVLVGT